VHVVPVGVEIDRFAPTPPVISGVPTIVFTGVMNYYPNQEAVEFFARKVLPLVARSVPGVRFLIVGRNPSRKVQALGRLPGVQVTGYVSDVQTYLAQAHVSVAPFTIAAGIQTKILEALSYGLPVVATPRVVQALKPEVAGIIETGDSEEELAKRVIRFLRDPALARRCGMEGRRRVREAYDWSFILQELLRLIEADPSHDRAPEPLQGATTGWN
jgi:glycosyltransferase involved in cell wall biosynthesis